MCNSKGPFAFAFAFGYLPKHLNVSNAKSNAKISRVMLLSI